ncbi:phosphotransferase system mannitol/fructose-specifc IIA component, partial [Chitinispirillum alkaliphilum]
MMSFEEYLVIPTVVELKSVDKQDALKELALAACKALDIKKQKTVVDEILKREESSSTFIGQGVALPQARAQIKKEFGVVVGRNSSGISYDAARNANAQIIVLLITRDDADTNRQIQLLSELETFFKSNDVRERILADESLVNIHQIISVLKSGVVEEKTVQKVVKKTSSPLFNSAMSLVRETKASALMVFADCVRDNDFLDQIKSRSKIIIVTSNKTRFEHRKDKRIIAIIQAPPIPASRTGQIKIGILLALSRGIISKDNWVVCVSGNSRSNVFDTIVTIDVALEYEFFFVTSQNLLPPDVKPEVLERIIGLAGEIAVEGREGKPTGTIFVLGDTNSVNA